MSRSHHLPSRRHLFPNLLPVIGAFIAFIVYFGTSLKDFTTILVIEGLILDVISAGLLATVETDQLYGRMSRQDIANEIEKRDRGIDFLETNLSLERGDPGFDAVKRAFEYEYEYENNEIVDISRFEYDIPDTEYWDMIEKRRGEAIDDTNLIDAHRASGLITKDPPTVDPITKNGNTVSNPPYKFNRFIRKSGHYFSHQRDMSYLKSAMVVLASGFSFQILAYVIKFFCIR